MPIDSKLAHGIARNSFQTIISFGSGLQNLLLHFHHRNKTQVTTPKGARKMIAQVRRYIITCAFWMAEMETNREGQQFIGYFSCRTVRVTSSSAPHVTLPSIGICC